MRFFVLIVLCLLGRSSLAQEDAYPYDLFGNPLTPLKVISANNDDKDEKHPIFLDCNDKCLLENLDSFIPSDKKILKDESIVAYRHRILAQKHITNFTSLSLDDFELDKNRQIAELLISEKINKGLQDKDFALCASDNPILKRKVYLLQQHNDDGDILVYVIGYNIDKIHQFICKKQ